MRFSDDGAPRTECDFDGVQADPNRPYTSLRVWQSSHELALELGKVARTFPKDERYVLATQLRRAALSVPANIVEGYTLWGTPSYLRHIRIALGSAAETEYFLTYALDAGYLKEDVARVLIEKASKVKAQLLALIRALQRR